MAKAEKNSKHQNIDINPVILDEIEEHAYSNLQAEVGGMLVGNVDGSTTKITGAIPALTASADQISLTFTHEVWDVILKQVHEKFPGQQIVGWYHTHPSFGLFLSQYDSFIQENFFSNPGQLALVIDPIAGDFAWFELDTKKVIHKFGEDKTKRGPRTVPGQKTEAAKGIKPLNVAVIAGISAVIVGAAVWSFGKISTPPDLTSVVANRDMTIQEMTLAEHELLNNPVLRYTTAEGDTLENIAERYYLDSSQSLLISQVNGLEEGAQLEVGTTLLLPHVPRITISQDNGGSFPSTPTPVPTPTETSSATPTPSAS